MIIASFIMTIGDDHIYGIKMSQGWSMIDDI